MERIKPLDQDILIGANVHNHTTKVHNKLDSQGSIMERLMDFASSVPDFRRLSEGARLLNSAGTISINSSNWAC